MSFDQNLIRVTTIGVVFLLILAFLTYGNIFKKQGIETTIIQERCTDCYARIDTLKKDYERQISFLKSDLHDKEIDLRILREQPNSNRNCQSLDELRAENEKLKVRLVQLQNEQKNYDDIVTQFEKCREAYRKITRRIDEINS